MYVAWLEVRDLELTFDSPTWGEPDLERSPDVGVSVPSLIIVSPFCCPADAFFSLDMSVSGGVGGRDDLFVEDLRGSSADFDLRASSPPTSVVSGVKGFDARAERSSLLRIASLLCALLKEG